MDSAQWTQEFRVAKSMGAEEMGGTRLMERKGRPQKEQAVNCPRCHSTNTKFCYYNNYSLTQPRYFCKTCRRYWTEGGTLRNVPVGGGSRKNKRYAATPPPNPAPTINYSLNPKIHDEAAAGHDLNLDYHHHGQFPKIESRDNVMHASSSSALNFLRGFNSFIPMPQTSSNVNNIFAPFQEYCKPVDDDVSNLAAHQNMNIGTTGSSLMFALQGSASKRTADQDNYKAGQQNPNGLWINGMLGGGSANW